MVDLSFPSSCSRSNRAICALVSAIEAFCGQVPVDDQFAAVRRGKELLLHEFHAEQRKQEGGDRDPDGDPAMMHADGKQTREHPRTRPFVS